MADEAQEQQGGEEQNTGLEGQEVSQEQQPEGGGEQHQEQPQVDFFALSAERTNGLIKDEESLNQFIEKSKKGEEYETAPDVIKKALSYVKAGGDFKEFSKLVTTDYSNLDNKTAIATKLKAEKPNYTDADIQLKIDVDYKIDEINAWEKEQSELDETMRSEMPKHLQLAKRQMELDALSAKEYLESTKPKIEDGYEHPELKSIKEAQALKEQKRAEYNENITKQIDSSFNKLEFSFNVKGTNKEDVALSFDFDVSPEQKELAKGLMTDMTNTLTKLFPDNNGGVDYLAMEKALIIGTDKKLQNRMVDNAVALYAAKLVQSMTNTNPSKLTNPALGAKTHSEQVAKTRASLATYEDQLKNLQKV